MMQNLSTLGPFTILAIVAIIFWPGMMAGGIVGLWHSLPGIAPGIAGFASTVATLIGATIITKARYSRSVIRGLWLPFIPFLVMVGIVYLVDLSDEYSPNYWDLIGIAILVGLLLVLVSSSPANAKGLVLAFSATSCVYGVGEVIRVLQGGDLRAQEGAFGANPIFGAHFLGIAILVSWALRARNVISGKLSAAIILVAGICMAVTLSRGPILALAIAIFFVLLFSAQMKSKGAFVRRIFYLLVGGLGSWAVLRMLDRFRGAEGDDASVEVRRQIWETVWGMVRSDPLFGVGPGPIASLQIPGMMGRTVSPHNIFLETWAMYGLVSLILMAGGLVWAFRSADVYGRATLLYICVCFSVSGTIGVSFNFWVGVAVSIIIGAKSLFVTEAPERNLIAEHA